MPPSHACIMRQPAARRWLSLQDVQAGVLTELRHYARTAWTFLHGAGYINFGVAPAIAKRALGTLPDRGSVIIVGAGLAGMLHCLWPCCHPLLGT